MELIRYLIMHHQLHLLVFVTTLFYLCSVSLANIPSACISKETCSSCIKTLGCSWCSKEMNSTSKDIDTLKRCMDVTLLQENELWCPPQFIVNVKSEVEKFQDDALTAGIEAIQIQPQRMRVKLRQGEKIKINFKYKQAVDYPVDLYYLMDLSASMADDRISLSKLGSKLAEEMKRMTNNFRLGFGSFVDKPEMPYTSTVPEKLISPCINPVSGEPCASPYGFKNHMPLTEDTEQFAKEVKLAPVSGNMDYPEGGLDGLMQALVCTKEIGWRQKARRLLIFSTDAGFHMAGDGKLAGIVERNDEMCHLNASGYYTYTLLTDYPSIAQLDRQAKKNNINIIFAVTQQQTGIYTKLKESIQGAIIGTLSKDSSNVVTLVRTEYEKLVDSVKITDNSGSSVEVQYYSKCLGNEEKQTSECGGLKGRPVVEFTAVLRAVDCPEDKTKWHQTIEIRPGSLNESLRLDVELICQCPCENKDQSTKSAACASRGSMQCGICSCEEGRYGRFCECDGHDATSARNDDSNCRADNSSAVCSDLGSCRCGACDCSKRKDPEEIIYGTYCQCNNFACNRNLGLLCSGPEKGRCECGTCNCLSGWSGVACECRDTNATCIAPDSDKVCSGQGSCQCGQCYCSTSDSFRYTGRYCEECPHCAKGRCQELRHCVECQVHGTGLYGPSECKLKCLEFQSETVDKIEKAKSDNDEEDTEVIDTICRIPDNAGCNIVFNYTYQEDQSLKVIAQKTKECGSEENLWAVIIGVVGSTLLAGILLLVLWKCITYAHDKREYIKFEKESKAAQFDRGDNPLYKPSTSTFSNPTFRLSRTLSFMR